MAIYDAEFWQARAEKAEAELTKVAFFIGSTRFMDPPDGGDVSISEQIHRMRHALDDAEAELYALRSKVACLAVHDAVERADKAEAERDELRSIVDRFYDKGAVHSLKEANDRADKAEALEATARKDCEDWYARYQKLQDCADDRLFEIKGLRKHLGELQLENEELARYRTILTDDIVAALRTDRDRLKAELSQARDIVLEEVARRCEAGGLGVAYINTVAAAIRALKGEPK